MKNVSIRVINIISVVIPLAVATLFKLKFPLGDWTKIFPHINAIINSATAILLICGLILIKKGKIAQHKKVMSLAFVLGALFLIFYVLYHISNTETHFGGEGLIKSFYYFILITHVVCSLIVLPFVLRSYYYGLNRMDERHKKINRIAFPLWLYVSITGVIAYLMISPYYI